MFDIFPHILFYSINGLANWHDFPDITHNKSNKGGGQQYACDKMWLRHKKAFVFDEKTYFQNSMAQHCSRNCQGTSFLKPHILFYSNGLVIWHSLPNIVHIKTTNGQ